MTPGAFDRLWSVGSLSRQTGIPATNTACEPIMGRAGPMMHCETTPPMAPASSPCVIACIPVRVSSGIALMQIVK